ncbi:MAG: uracil-DNA glycosylase [Hyphomicrobiaceae bacterium]
MTRELTMEEILGLIDWQRSMGADSVVGETPLDWLARGPAAPSAAFDWPDRPAHGEADSTADRQSWPPHGVSTGSMPTPLGAPGAGPSGGPARAAGPSPVLSPPWPAAAPPRFETRPVTPLAPSAAETEARTVARQASSLDELEKALRDFDGCGLKATATNLCFFRGAPQARLMLIGEAPGRDEDLAGKPFVGRAGQLLDKMLAAIGLDESQVHITNIVYWRPPGNRTPTPQEAIACRPFLERQMELVAPDFIVVLGGAAAKEVFSVAEGIMRLRGKWRQIKIGERFVPAVATLHPAYLLRTPAAKQLAWSDLLALRAKLTDHV